MLVLGGITTLNMALDIGRPFGGYIAVHNTGNDKYYLQAVPPWWPPLPGQGIVLSALAGQPYSPAEASLFQQAYERGQASLEVTREFWDQAAVIPVPVRLFSLGDFLDLRLTPVLLGLVFWLTAWVVFRDAPQRPLNRSFVLVCAVVAGQLWLERRSLFDDSGWLTAGISLATKLSITSFIGIIFIHFGLMFPQPLVMQEPWAGRLRRLIQMGYGFGGVVAAGYIVAAIGRAVGFVGFNVWEDWAFTLAVYLVLAGLGVLLTRSSLVLLWGPAAGLPQAQVRVMWLGWIGAAPVIILLAASFLGWVDLYQGYLGTWDIRYLYLGIPLALGFLVLRHQTFAAVSRDYLYLLVLALSAALASVGDALLRALQPSIFRVPPMLPLLGLLLAISLFWVRQLSQRGFFGRGVNWEAHGYDTLQQFIRALAAQRSLAQIPAVVPQVLVTELLFESAALYRWEAARSAFQRAAYAGRWTAAPPETLNAPATGLRDLPSPFRVTRAAPAWPWWLEPLCAGTEVEAVGRLWLPEPETALGFLVLGKRQDEERFDERDLVVLSLLSQLVALALVAVRQSEERQQVVEWAAAAEDRERSRIARDLHDTVQQFFAGLVYTLENSRALLLSAPAEADQLLQVSAQEAQAADAELRQILKDLTDEQVQDGLAQPITVYVTNFQNRTGLTTALHLSPDAGLALPPKARLAVYRVIGQALENVAHHAQATYVTVTVAETDHHLRFEVADNGHGFAVAQPLDGHYGLRFMMARIQEWGGALAVHSAPGQGTRIEGEVPKPG